MTSKYTFKKYRDKEIYEQGRADERKRIKDVYEFMPFCLNGAILGMMFDGKSKGEDARKARDESDAEFNRRYR